MMAATGLRQSCRALLLAGGLLLSAPAFADQNLMVADNGEVRCDASAKDLTRISLKDDAFGSVSKVQTGDPLSDFSVVNDPIRGDIYLSVPDGFSRKAISFFGTTRKGFVYKFVCQISGDDAKQIFIGNADLERPAGSAPETIAANLAVDEQAVRLVQAMDRQAIVEGYEIIPEVRSPVNVGWLKVQMIAQYLGPTMSGKTIKIENTGRKAVELGETDIARNDVIALSIVNPRLEPGQATTAYVVQSAGVTP